MTMAPQLSFEVSSFQGLHGLSQKLTPKACLQICGRGHYEADWSGLWHMAYLSLQLQCWDYKGSLSSDQEQSLKTDFSILPYSLRTLLSFITVFKQRDGNNFMGIKSHLEPTRQLERKLMILGMEKKEKANSKSSNMVENYCLFFWWNWCLHLQSRCFTT
jgi:hypothetical protein